MAVCVLFALFVSAIGVIGILGVRSATQSGSEIATGELTTSTMTAQLARSMDLVYSTAERALFSGDVGQRVELMSSLSSQLIPNVDVRLGDLQVLHASDPPAEIRDFQLFAKQWRTVRNLLSSSIVLGGSGQVTAARLTLIYQPLSRHIDRLIVNEQGYADAQADQASSMSAGTLWTIVGAIALALTTCALLAWTGTRRIRKVVGPEQDQVEFAETLQIAGDEEEAHQLLQRHLERSLAGSTAVILSRNNSADLLEAVTPLPSGSSLAESLRGAQPRSCLAVRSGRSHFESTSHPGLLPCSVCSICPGNSTCVPLTVGGEVIGSVLLNRETAHTESEDQRIRESVSQAAPVLANLRNLAGAEVRAATDGLTGLPNKRAVTETMKRMFALASRTGSSLTLVLLDLDHFKQINDQLGHPVGDQVLANVGAILRRALRAGDFAARNGGEEFALILPGTDASTGYLIAERVRAAIADITLPGIDVSVTASLGVAGFPEHASTPERLERLADAALYVAKRSGRNRSESADPSIEADALDEASLTARDSMEEGHPNGAQAPNHEKDVQGRSPANANDVVKLP
jgi:diguanylate cyclase (GGDEF)-like protein